jgi:hypothetical protein
MFFSRLKKRGVGSVSAESVVPQRIGVLLMTRFFAAALLMSVCTGAPAQVLYGTLLGNVTDTTGAVVAGATVTATNNGTGVTMTATTDNSGIYRFGNLITGTYKVSISAPAFASAVGENILIQTNAERRFDAQLHPESVGQTITVTTAPPDMQTDTASVSSVIESAQLQTIVATPGAGMRNFQSLYMILPGFTPPSASHSESGNPGDTLYVNVNGVSGSNNNTRIDGVSDIYPWLPEIAAYAPSTEAIATVNAVTNSFDAEQGFASGAAVNVTTKSGTNRFHGSAWEYNTISALMAKGTFVPKTRAIPKYIMNQFGANYGGPILKNKAFFFGNWERSRRSQAVSGLQTVPTLDMLGLNGNGFSFLNTGTTIYDPATGDPTTGKGRTPFQNNTIPAGRVSYAAQQMIALMKASGIAPNVTSPGLSNNYFVAADAQYTRDNVDARVDYNLNTNNTVFGRYGIQKTNIFDPQALAKAGGNTLDGGQPGTSPSIVQSIGAGMTHTFTPNLLLDANFGYLRQGMSAKNSDLGTQWGLSYFNIPGTNGTCSQCGGMPSFNFGGLSSLGNPNRSNPFEFRDNTYTTAANLSWNRGKHSLRFGMEFQRYAMNHFQPQNTYGPRGGFNFSGGQTALNGGTSPNGYNAWADFLLGIPQMMQKDTQYLNPATIRENVWAFYARDQWQITNKLTLTYGARYEYYPIATRDHSGLGIFNPNDGLVYIGGVNGIPKNGGVSVGWGQIVPRAGIAYRLDPKTVVRAGFGISTNPDNFRNMLTNYPAVISQSISGSTTYLPSYTVNGAAATLSDGIPSVSLPNLSSGTVALGGLGTPKGTLGVTTLPRNYRRGYYESYNLAVQRELPGATTVQAAYVGTLIIREVPGININAGTVPGAGQAGQPLNKVNGVTTYGITAGVTSLLPIGTGHYNALQAEVKHRFAENGSAGLNYTYSRSINDYGDASDGWSSLPVAARPFFYLNKAVAGFDRSHNIQAYGNYTLPFGNGQRFASSGTVAHIIGNWELSGSMNRESGTPFTVTAGSNSLNMPGNTQFADQLVKHVKILGGHDSTHPYFDVTNFADPLVAEKAANPTNPVNRFGTAGRNSVRGPGLFNLSASLSRTFPITDRYGIQFRAESFNLTNTPSFANPAAGVTAANGFGTISNTQNNSRQVRLSGRFNF